MFIRYEERVARVPGVPANSTEPDPEPPWFRDAIRAPREQSFTSVAGCRISYWRWGPAGRPGIVLVHGGGAHAHWWDHVAPWLVTSERSVVAIDLSGHGDSGHRSEYGLQQWAEEILAVARHAGLDGPPLLVGHSLGGWSATVAAAEHAHSVRGLVLVDSRVIDPLGAGTVPAPRPEPRRPRVYATLDEVVARYRPEPPQEDNLAFVVRRLAAHSARQVEGGWTWKFDPAALYQQRPGRAALECIRCRVCLVRGEHGLVSPDVIAAVHDVLGEVPIVDIPVAGHHLMLDHPLSLVTALRSVLAMWGGDGVTGGAGPRL